MNWNDLFWGISGEELILINLISFLGSFVQSVLGLGFALVLAPLLYFIDPEYVPGAIIYAGFWLSLINAIRHRKSFNLTGFGTVLIGRFPGMFIAVILLIYFSDTIISIVIGISIILATVLSAYKWKIKINRWTLFIAGLVSGITGTTAGIGGPPVAIVFQNEKASSLRANLGAYFTITSALSILFLLIPQQIGWRQVQLFLILMPGVFLGFFCSKTAIARLKQDLFRKLILLLCFSGGTIIIFKIIFSN